MAQHPRILSLRSALPARNHSQADILATLQKYLLGQDWSERPERVAEARQLAQLFHASRVEQRQSVIDLSTYYDLPRTTGERMAAYQTAAYTLGRTALEAALAAAQPMRASSDISDIFVVSCTGYSAPGLDILLARDLAMPAAIRRVCIGHMGCFGALVGIRQCLDAVRAHPGATAALLSVELTSLHFMPTNDVEALTSFALFGDAAAALLMGDDPEGNGPEVIEAYCVADFAAADQMSWTITDQGFVMGLSPRVPVTLRRHVSSAVTQLLAPHGLTTSDIKHWIIHPGGPSILQAIQGKLELSEAQMALSWQVLREHGNCSSATVLLILEELLQSKQTQRGEWGVMMAFGPGLTLETCLLRF